MGELIEKTLESMQAKRQRSLKGYINCIPSPFRRFSNDFIGIEQNTYYTVTSFTKGKLVVA